MALKKRETTKQHLLWDRSPNASSFKGFQCKMNPLRLKKELFCASFQIWQMSERTERRRKQPMCYETQCIIFFSSLITPTDYIHPTCRSDQYQCMDDYCIETFDLCNGAKDCLGGEDEDHNCTTFDHSKYMYYQGVGLKHYGEPFVAFK